MLSSFHILFVNMGLHMAVSCKENYCNAEKDFKIHYIQRKI